MARVINNILIVTFIMLLSSLVWAQQSTSGPEPPPGLDPGLTTAKMSHVVISGVPAYIWHHGCGPTALGMVIGYYDGHGYPGLIQGDAGTQTTVVNAVIANDNENTECDESIFDHYQDYACPIDYRPTLNADCSETGEAHIDNCLADFMRTSRSSSGNYYGWSWFDDMPHSFTDYVNMRLPESKPGATGYVFSQFSWEDFKNQIDLNRPVVLLVDTDGNNDTDHFVTAIGYDRLAENYAILNTWDNQVHWYAWREIKENTIWGIYGAVTFIFGVPDVIETLPAHNADKIDVTSDVIAVFDVAMDPATLNETSIFVYAQHSGVHSCDFNYDSATHSVILDPVEDFVYNERVTVYLLNSVASTTGAHLTANYIFAFYTKCCEGWTGNIDCSLEEGPDITDITFLISHIYLRKQSLCCADEADIDASGGEPDISDIIRYNPNARTFSLHPEYLSP